MKNGIFTVSYTRAFKTTDPSNLDYTIILGDNQFIWSFGSVVGGAPQPHQSPENNGRFSLNLLSGESSVSYAKYLTASLALFLGLITFM